MAVVTRVLWGTQPLLSHSDARREAEEFLTQFTVLYPNALLFRTALRGAAAYQLSWFDAHLWAYAETLWAWRDCLRGLRTWQALR